MDKIEQEIEDAKRIKPSKETMTFGKKKYKKIAIKELQEKGWHKVVARLKEKQSGNYLTYFPPEK